LTKFVFEYKIIFTVFRKGGKNMNENKKGLKRLLGIFLSLMVIAFIVITSEGSFAGSSTSSRRLSGSQSEPASYQLGAGLAEVNDTKEKNELGNHPEENLREPQKQNEEVKETPSQTDINPFAALAYALLGLFGLGSVSFGKVFQEFLQSYSRNKGVYVKEQDRENVLSLINTGATKEYEIDDAGFLKESENQPQKEGSKTFTQMVDKLINADKKTVIGFDDKVLKVDENGKAYQEDVLGINVGTNGTDQVLVINPDFSSTIREKETIGLLAHEMAHAIDGIEGTKTDDPFTNEKVALGSENNVREELGLGTRELEADDLKGDGVYSYFVITAGSLLAILAGKYIIAGLAVVITSAGILYLNYQNKWWIINTQSNLAKDIIGRILKIKQDTRQTGDITRGMSRKQRDMYNKEIHRLKREYGMRPNDNLPWPVLVEIANEVRRLYK
jgi:hypothetical protein